MNAIFLVKVLSVIAEIRIDPGEVHKRPQGPTSVWRSQVLVDTSFWAAWRPLQIHQD
jgi:hypothetical protein